LQTQNQAYHELAKHLDQLQKEAARVLQKQAEVKCGLKAEILNLDKQAEELMGVDDEASDKLFAQKLTLEKELKILVLEQSIKNDLNAEKLSEWRHKLLKLEETSKSTLIASREDFVLQAQNKADICLAVASFLSNPSNGGDDHFRGEKRQDHFDQPFLTHLPKLSLKEAGRMIQDCLNQDNFNNLAKPVDPQMGDLYIYKCGAWETVHVLDGKDWKYSHKDTRKNQLHFPGRLFTQYTYQRSQNNLTEKKIMLVDSLRGVVVLHYR